MMRPINLLLLLGTILFVAGCQTTGNHSQAEQPKQNTENAEHLQVKDLAQFRFAISNPGSHLQYETYLRDGHAELVIDPEYATIPNASIIANKINGVVAVPSHGCAAQIVDRSVIRIWVPKEPGHANDDFNFLAEVLRTTLDRAELESYRHISRPSPWKHLGNSTTTRAIDSVHNESKPAVSTE